MVVRYVQFLWIHITLHMMVVKGLFAGSLFVTVDFVRFGLPQKQVAIVLWSTLLKTYILKSKFQEQLWLASAVAAR
jgi:hypothetical protein